MIARQTHGDPYALAQQLVPRFKEFDRGEVRAYFDHVLSETEVAYAEEQLLAQGVVLTESVYARGSTLYIPFEVRFFPLLAIAGVLGAGFFGWLAWDVWQETKQRFTLAMVLGAGIAVVAVVVLLKGPGTEAVRVIERRMAK